MKKLSLIIAMTVISTMSFAQLTLLHTFDTNVTLTLTFTYAGYSMPDKYSYIQREDGTAKNYVYDADFSLYGLYTITPVNIPEGYTLSSCSFLSNHLINNDDEYEWLVYANNSSADASSQCYTYIENSRGEIIYDFGYDYYSTGNLYFHIANGQLRTSWTRYEYIDGNLHYYTDIYACGGNVTNVNQNKKEVSMSAYPNPAISFINLPYELNEGETSTMNIYDINGRLIEQKPIGYHFNNIVLETSDYKAGTYIYEYNGKSNRFIVQ